MPFGIGGTELIVVLIIVLVLFGPSQLPKLGKMLGQTTRSLREGMEGVTDEPKSKKKKAKAEPAEAADVEEPAAEAEEPAAGEPEDEDGVE